MDDDDVDAHGFHLPGHRDLVRAEHDVAHDVAAVVLGRAHGLADRVLVRLTHHHDERRAVPEHHLGFEVARIHRLQVGDDRMTGILLVERGDRVEPLAQDERRPDFQPIDAGPNRDLGRRQRVSHRLQVERELDFRRAVEKPCGQVNSSFRQRISDVSTMITMVR